jgi:Spy/CpxP family protein refolding chaperone
VKILNDAKSRRCKMMRRIAAVAAAVTLLGGAVAAAPQVAGMHDQDPNAAGSMGMAQGMMMGGMMGQGMVGSGMMQMIGQGMGMMATGGPGAAAILRMRDALDLTDDQVSRLEKIQQDLQTTVQPQMTAMMSTQSGAAQALRGDSPDFNAYQQSLQAAANIMVQAHVAMARSQVEARNVLTPEQRQKLQTQGGQMMQGTMGTYGWGGMMRH